MKTKIDIKNTPFYWKRCIALLIVLIVFVASVCSNALYSLDMSCVDKLMQRQSVPMKNIHILAIDDRTIAKYGDMSTWDRGIYADLVDLLDSDTDYAPAVIGFDILFTSEKDSEADSRLAAAASEYGNVVSAVNLVYRDELSLGSSGIEVAENQVVRAELPYTALQVVSQYGFANVLQDQDGVIRHALQSEDYQGAQINSFAYEVASMYAKRNNIDISREADWENQVHGFRFSGRSGSYEVISLCDVLDGTVDTRTLAGGIVLVGAYAPGLMDAYNVAIQRGSQMYGVEINANLVEAYLEDGFYETVPTSVYIIASVIILILYFILCGYISLLWELLEFLFFLVAQTGLALILADKGVAMPVIYLPICEIMLTAYMIVDRYLAERTRRKKAIAAMGKYLAPQVIEDLTKSGEFDIQLGVNKRDIAVLFVDIRGFTTMSESLEPEQVAEILNDYLGLTTECIFRHGGTLDKFVGDCTMGVFGAPLDLDDYVYKAVCAAHDIVIEGRELGERLKDKYGTSVGFGVGVNCGPAVVGNIGCEFRMDYTAIGDTVNTAARLEANAASGQVLISDRVYELLKDRIEVSAVGTIPLKGKSKEVFVYELTDVKTNE